MPLYEWRCQDCGSKFELLTSYENSLGAMVCTTCHSTNVRKLLSVFARPVRSGSSSDDFGDVGEGGFDDGASEDFDGGGCNCGGACSCNN